VAAKLSRPERIVAICLAAIWIAGGCTALYLALTRSRWLIAACALAAVAYGVAWVRVALAGRLLTWPGLFRPWRSGD